MRFLFIFIAVLGLLPTAMVSAQADVLEPIAETDLDANGKKLFVNAATGIPVLQTLTEYLGMSPADGSIMWRVERNGGAAVSEMLDDQGENVDFDEIPNTPLVMASGTLINVTNGEVIIDGAENDLRRLRTHYVLPSEDIILLEIAGKGAIYLYAINPFEDKQLWGVQLREASGVSQLISTGGGTGELDPMLNAAGNLIYDNGKYLALVDMKTGELKWNEKLNAGYIFTSPDGTRMIVAEARNSLGGAMMAASLGGGAADPKLSKKIHLLDTETGQSVWKKEKKMDGSVLYVMPYQGDFLVVHDEGMNIYSFTDPKGDGRWKKGYKEKGVVNIEPEEEGLMVYFKKKRMLVDPVTGDDKWKKAEKLEREPGGFFWGSANYKPLTKRIGQYDVTFYHNSFQIDGYYGWDRFYYGWIVVEDDRIITANEEDPGVARVGKRQFTLKSFELGEDKVTTKRKTIGVKRGIADMDKVAGGYFVYNDRGYVLMSYDPVSGWEERAQNYYPDPTALGRSLLGVATVTGSLAFAGAQTSNMLQSVANPNKNSSDALSDYRFKMNTMNAGFNAGTAIASNRKINGRVDDDYAFFFARDGKEGATLFKVNKNSGEEVAKFRFDDLTPLYEIDYINRRLYYQANNKFSVFKLK